MAKGKNIFKAIGSMPLINFQRTAVRYRLRLTEPGEFATTQRNRARSSSAECSFGDRMSACEDSCKVRP